VDALPRVRKDTSQALRDAVTDLLSLKFDGKCLVTAVMTSSTSWDESKGKKAAHGRQGLDTSSEKN